MYGIMALISYVVRQFYLPNPYITYFASGYEGFADIFNIIVGGAILHFFAYTITGIYYTKGTNAFIGSISYLFWYIICGAIISFIGLYIKSIKAAIILFIFAYLLICLFVGFLKNKFYYYNY